MEDHAFFDWIKACRDGGERWSDISAKMKLLLSQAKAGEIAERQMQAKASEQFPLGTRKRIYLSFVWPQTGLIQRQGVEGRIISIPGYEEFDLVVHPNLSFRGEDGQIDETTFLVSEASSGLLLGPVPPASTPELAAYLVADKMKRRNMTPEKMRQRIRQHLDKLKVHESCNSTSGRN